LKTGLTQRRYDATKGKKSYKKQLSANDTKITNETNTTGNIMASPVWCSEVLV